MTERADELETDLGDKGKLGGKRKPKTMLQDSRSIKAIQVAGSTEASWFGVFKFDGPVDGEFGNCDAIVPYLETDSHVWFAIYEGTKVVVRINAAFVAEVSYVSDYP